MVLRDAGEEMGVRRPHRLLHRPPYQQLHLLDRCCKSLFFFFVSFRMLIFPLRPYISLGGSGKVAEWSFNRVHFAENLLLVYYNRTEPVFHIRRSIQNFIFGLLQQNRTLSPYQEINSKACFFAY